MKWNVYLLLVTCVGYVGCGGSGELATHDGGVVGVDGGVVTTPVCEPGDTLDCAEVAAAFAPGADARCAPSRTRWDVTACVPVHQATGDHTAEVVYPAQRNRERWGNARCSYEGDFVFEVFLSPTPTDVWEINLEGGALCFLDSDNPKGGCHDRELWKVAPYRTRTDPFVRYAPDGTVEHEDPFGEYSTRSITSTANVVYTNYCSNDLWTGTSVDDPVEITYLDPRTNTEVRRPWVFTGRLNVRAMLEILIERYGLDDQNPNLKVHFRGQSAGGVGVMNNAWVIHQYLPNAASDHRIMVSSWEGFTPSGDWDPTQYGLDNPDDFWPSGMVGVTGQAVYRIAAGAWNSEYMPACTAARPGSVECLYASILYDYVSGEPSALAGALGMPTLVYQNRQDIVWTSFVGMLRLSNTSPPDQFRVRDEWVARMNDEMGLTPGPNAGRIAWLFAPSDPTYVGEPIVHPPLDYFDDAPGPDEMNLDGMTERFWSHVGDPNWRDYGEVIASDCNWMVRSNAVRPEEATCY